MVCLNQPSGAGQSKSFNQAQNTCKWSVSVLTQAGWRWDYLSSAVLKLTQLLMQSRLRHSGLFHVTNLPDAKSDE